MGCQGLTPVNRQNARATEIKYNYISREVGLRRRSRGQQLIQAVAPGHNKPNRGKM